MSCGVPSGHAYRRHRWLCVEEDDRLRGLEIGADDYVTKPFSPRELVMRVQAVLRRASPSGDAFRAADLAIDTTKLLVTRDGRAIDVTPTEFQLLATLARHPGRVFTRAQLLDAVRGSAAEAFARAIDAHVKNIRRQLGEGTYLVSVYGIGYKFNDA